MCGIAGFIDPGTANPEAACRAMARALVHRGPDDCGYYIQRDVGLGLSQRRLSIVDLSPAGHQPMRSASGRATATGFERVGARFGAPRRPEQTVAEYARVLQAAGVPELPLRRVVAGIEVEAFSGERLDDAERDDVEAALAEAERR